MIRAYGCCVVPNQPRNCLNEGFEMLFGRVDDAPWRQELFDKEAAWLSASYRQHLVILRVRRALKAERRTQRQLAEQIGIDPETLRRKMRGESPLSWDLASALALEFRGLRVLPDGDELLPLRRES